jgi:hypothetical protein
MITFWVSPSNGCTCLCFCVCVCVDFFYGFKRRQISIRLESCTSLSTCFLNAFFVICDYIYLILFDYRFLYVCTNAHGFMPISVYFCWGYSHWVWYNMKLVLLINICLNENYNEVCIGKNSSLLHMGQIPLIIVPSNSLHFEFSTVIPLLASPIHLYIPPSSASNC